MPDAIGDAIAAAVIESIYDAIPHAAILAALSEPDCHCDRYSHPHAHVTPEHVADALLHADDDPTADTAY